MKLMRLGIVSLLMLISSQAYAQPEIHREVRVVKPYTPTLSDAEKINLLPDMRDTMEMKPDFTYSIVPRQFNTPYALEQIRPARLVGLPLEKLYKGQLTAGLGNYKTPLAELSINQLRSRKSAMGLYLKHHSSAGEVKLDNDLPMYAGFSDNQAEMYGKWFLNESVLEADIGGNYQVVHHYGYNTGANVDTLLDKKEIRQAITSTGGKLRFFSSHADSVRLKHNSGAGYKYTFDRFENTEHAIQVNTDLSKKFGQQHVGLFLGMENYIVSPSIDSSANTVFRLNPFIRKRGNNWMVIAGFKAVADIRGDNPEFKLYPRALFEYHAVKDVLTPYLTVDGKREVNNYSKVLEENPFVTPGLLIKNSNYIVIASAGLKGRYSSKMAFNINASFSMIDDMYFFVNDTSSQVANMFTATYDDVLLTTYSFDLSWNPADKINILFKGIYNQYELDTYDHPWHKPKLELHLGTSYNLRDKILMDADLFYTGKRFALTPDPYADPVELNDFLDANLKIEYRYTKLLSFFLRFNNISATRYQIWNQYPVQRFQLLGGFSLAF